MRPDETISIRVNPIWRHGDRVRWGGQLGVFALALDGGIHAQIGLRDWAHGF